MRVLMTGGGTAGHVNPALAIAGIIKEREESVIEFVGCESGLEGRLVPEAGYKLHKIDVRGLSRSLSLSNVNTLIKAYKAIGVCKKIIKEFAPDVVIGTGGYVCWPVIMAASSLGGPCTLHEANASAGLAVKTLKSKADLIMLGFSSAGRGLEGKKAKLTLTGLPVRAGFRGSDKALAREKCAVPASVNKMVVSFGGSLGADKINTVMLDFIDKYVRENPDVYLVHATGRRSWDDFSKKAEERGFDKIKNLEIVPYINDMETKLSAADLAICRAGASTLAELAAAGCPAILIPSPNVTADQQTKNARMFEEEGGALLIADNALEAESLASCVDGVLRGLVRSEMVKALIRLDNPDCDDRIYAAVKGIVK